MMWTLCVLSTITATHIVVYGASIPVTVCGYRCDYVEAPLKVYVPYGDYCMIEFYRKK